MNLVIRGLREIGICLATWVVFLVLDVKSGLGRDHNVVRQFATFQIIFLCVINKLSVHNI